jgi:DNA-binding NarL/FixJ family response regulator
VIRTLLEKQRKMSELEEAYIQLLCTLILTMFTDRPLNAHERRAWLDAIPALIERYQLKLDGAKLQKRLKAVWSGKAPKPVLWVGRPLGSMGQQQSNPKRDEGIRLLKQGRSRKQVAKALKVSDFTVYYWSRWLDDDDSSHARSDS